MDDEDGEPGNMETWNVHNSATIDGISVKETLMRANGSQQHLDIIDDPKEKKDRPIVQQKSKAPNALPQIVSCVPYKGYKKRILAQSQDNDKGEIRSKNTSKERRLELLKRGNEIAEYAQYLGLQPSTNFLGRNGPRPNCALPMGPGPSSDCLPTPNFNRKVYLCSGCNTYFENWHLFLHMRDVHERHICLFCLGLFDQVERLSHHLSKNHSIPESEYTSVEDFQRIFRGSCYLICCSCEKLFTESDNFYNHYCAGSKQSSKTASNICSVCKQVDSHLRTCSMAPDTEDELSPTTAREISRKMSRVNRVKQAKARRSLGAFETNKPKPVTDKVESTDVNVPVGENERVGSSTRDTVAETIMEVSRCMDGEEKFREEKNEPEMMEIDKGEKVEETEKNLDNKTCVDEEKSEPVKSATVEEQRTENSDLTNHLDNAEPVSANGEIPIEKDKIEEPEKVNLPKNDNLPEVLEPTESEKVNGDCSLSSDRSSSPTNQEQSVFSPIVENNVEAESSKNTSEETTAEQESETKERVTVSINAVPSSDRSLVFKICTNKNTFSISKSTKSETPRESEENNNSQASTSETRWNHCFKDSEQDGEKGNVSDSDSDRLAVVDSNDSEAENKEDDQEEEEDVGPAEKSNEPEKSTVETNETEEQEKEVEEKVEGDGIALAGPEIPVIDVNVEGILETMEIEDLLKKCISAASPTCVFCNHARLVAVNGKQLGLHMLAEHRFQPQHPAIIIQLDQFVTKVKNCLAELETCFFNLDSYDSKKSGTFNVSETRVYECFHCRFSSAVHKELYLHNRKMHQKSIILCVMCKSTFHSYSELLCHLCPGIYAANRDIRYRCCLCPVSNLPSAFRLMVHLRKVHHACDVCLESTGNQQRLSNHVWKHKLNHLCYRCGISYRNKPDITKHLFWKHGTESVLCKKCLQKKWPHVYHFCVPPTAFTCEECNLTFGKAVALKVHKRLHTNELPYSCSECADKFVSRKLLQKHEDAHRAPPPPPVEVVAAVAKSPQDKDVSVDSETVKDETDGENANDAEEKKEKEIKEPIKKVGVLDLPPLNLSSDSDSESDQETVEKKTENDQGNNEVPKVTTEAMEEEPSIRETDNLMDVERDEEEKKQEAQIMDGIWDNFKSYTASLKTDEQKEDADTKADLEFLKSVIMAEHDYWVVYPEINPEVNGETVEKTELNNEVAKSPVQAKENSAIETLESPKKKLKSPKKSKQSGSSSSDSSSDDSSSCSCGTNCSCSSSSSNSSSSSSSSSDSDSSDTESSPKKSSRRDRKKDGSEKAANCSSESEPKNENGEVQESVVDIVQVSPVKIAAAPRESDLETDETLTDEDFYDEHPQLLALKMLAEKRNQQLMMLASVAEDQPVTPAEPLNNGISEPVNEVNNYNDKPASTKNRKKVKNKKRKKSYKQKVKNQAKPPVESIKLNIPKAYYHHKTPASASQLMTPPTSAGFYATSTPKVQPMKLVNQNVALITPENENKRSSKRKRIPKRFYGDSSDEENDKQVPKWRKVEPSFVIRQPAPPVQQPMPSIIPTVAPPAPAPVTYYQPPAEVEASGSDTDEAADSSSDSDSEPEQPQIAAPPLRVHPPERANLYCFCQCPYDEVSEMIACDAGDCRIEWFHFECVGIVIPPKGKWYCPDCSRRLGLPQTSEDHAN